MISHKYDAWHRDFLQKFGGVVGEHMQAMHRLLQDVRQCLESITLHGGMDKVVPFVTLVHACSEHMSAWTSRIATLEVADGLLRRNR